MDDKNVRLSWGRLFGKTKGELLTFLVIMVAVAFTLPKQALIGLFSLLSAKVLTLTIGVFCAHLFRIIAFPYLDLSRMVEEHHWGGVVFLAVWYGIIIYAMAIGG